MKVQLPPEVAPEGGVSVRIETPPPPPPPEPVPTPAPQPPVAVRATPVEITLPPAEPAPLITAPVTANDATTTMIAEPAPSAAPTAPSIQRARPIGPPPQPRFPRVALERGIAGLVSLRLEIGADGRVTSVAVTREEPDGYGFARAAVEAVRQARFSPLLINGEPAPGTFSYQVRFQVTQ